MDKPTLAQNVTEHENVLTCRMEELRDAWGYARLGIHVRRQISNDLRGMGIGHYPAELPDYQDRQVRLYKLGTPVAHIIEAVLNPSQENDDQLRQMTAGDARETLDAIKALVCE
jgi:hypothetical protein